MIETHSRKTLAALLASIAIGSMGACSPSAESVDTSSPSAESVDAPAPTPKGYVIAEINVTDIEGYREYVAVAAPIIEKYGGTFLARAGQTIHVEGQPPAERVMIIEFESLEQAKTFEYSKDYTDIAPLRQRTSTSRIFLLEGTANAAANVP